MQLPYLIYINILKIGVATTIRIVSHSYIDYYIFILCSVATEIFNCVLSVGITTHHECFYLVN